MLKLSNAVLQLECPNCKNPNSFSLEQAQRNETIKCSGCGLSIVLSDNGSTKRAQDDINRSLESLSNTIKRFNKK